MALALVAGAPAPTALRLGLAMTAIQFSIGTLNDMVDAPRDRGRAAAKPIAEGLIAPRAARLVLLLSAATGFGLAAISGGLAIAIAAGGAACGYVYDLRLSRTPWAWLPLALALPLVPAFAWAGVTGGVPGELLALMPIAMLAGGGLAVGNALADSEIDRASGSPSVAVRFGRRVAWRLHALALMGSAGLVFVSLPRDPAVPAVTTIAIGTTILAVGIGAVAAAPGPGPALKARLGWMLEAIGVAALGVGWALAIVATREGAP